MGIISGAIGGLGEGLVAVGKQYAGYIERSSLQEEAAKIQELRDERMLQLREQYDVRAEDRKRAQYSDAEGIINTYRNTPIVSGEEDAVSRAPNEKEVRAFRRSEMLRRGLISPKDVESAENDESRTDAITSHYRNQDARDQRKTQIEADRWEKEFKWREKKLDQMIARGGQRSGSTFERLDEQDKLALTGFNEELKKYAKPLEFKDIKDEYEALKTEWGEQPKDARTAMPSISEFMAKKNAEREGRMFDLSRRRAQLMERRGLLGDGVTAWDALGVPAPDALAGEIADKWASGEIDQTGIERQLQRARSIYGGDAAKVLEGLRRGGVMGADGKLVRPRTALKDLEEGDRNPVGFDAPPSSAPTSPPAAEGTAFGAMQERMRKMEENRRRLEGEARDKRYSGNAL